MNMTARKKKKKLQNLERRTDGSSDDTKRQTHQPSPPSTCRHASIPLSELNQA